MVYGREGGEEGLIYRKEGGGKDEERGRKEGDKSRITPTPRGLLKSNPLWCHQRCYFLQICISGNSCMPVAIPIHIP